MLDAIDRFYAWMNRPTRAELRRAERETARQAQRWLRRQQVSRRQAVAVRAACDLVTLLCLAGVILVLAFWGRITAPDQPAGPERYRPVPSAPPAAPAPVRV